MSVKMSNEVDQQIIDYTEMQFRKNLLFTEALIELAEYAMKKNDIELSTILARYANEYTEYNKEYSEKYSVQ